MHPENVIGKVDASTERLSKLLEGRVNPPLSRKRLQELHAEADSRRTNREPPGFKDENGGDFIWWSECLETPLSQEKILVIVSDDLKKNDWLHVESGQPCGPLEGLLWDVEESHAKGVISIDTATFMKSVNAAYGNTSVAESSIEESENLALTLNPQVTDANISAENLKNLFE